MYDLDLVSFAFVLLFVLKYHMKQASMEREIKELEKQEAKHFEARHKALEAAMKATSNCPPADTECQQAAEHVNWKMAKDKYEQAAMQDIMKEEKTKKDESAGMAMFEGYSKLADALSGVPQLKSLYNQTNTEEQSRSQKERSALTALKQADAELRQLEDAKIKLQHIEQEKKQKIADAKAAESLKQQLESATVRPTTVTLFMADFFLAPFFVEMCAVLL
jgi:hypothetical protein